ncbi:MAG: inositol monophosphatase [Rhizobiaceae bacterium]|nr:inositol monophosphatase [Rhizobiaceae bacterium]
MTATALTPSASNLEGDADDPLGTRLAAARRIAEGAGRTALAFFAARGTLTIERKSAVQDLVSQADREVEDEIRAAIRNEFPNDALLGEEHGLSEGSSPYTWIIDPIDGTSPFLVGQPNWCVSIAVSDGTRPVCGVVHAPVLGETYVARTGRGAFLNGERLMMDGGWTLTSANIAFGGTNKADPAASGAFVAGLYRDGGVIFRIGSGALMLCYVAAGRLAGYYDPAINIWDCAAGIVIVEQAGGVTEFTGGFSASGPLWSGNAGVVGHLKRLSEGTEAVPPVNRPEL